MTGVGYALLSLLWARALMVLDVEELEAVVPLSSLVILPCVVVYPLLEGVVGVVATALLPLMSGVLLLLCLREGAKRGGVEEAASSVGGMSPYLKDSEASGAASASSGAGAALSRRSGIAESWGFYLGRVAVVLVVLYLAIGWQAALADVRDSMHALIDLDVSMLISSLASVALGIAIVFFSRRVSFTGLFRWAVPCVIITLVLHGSSGLWVGFVSNAIGDTLDSLIQVLVYLFAITLAKQGKAPVALGVGLLNGSVQLGVLFGNLAGSACAGPAAASSEAAFLSALICLVALVGIAAPQREPIEVRPMAAAGSDALEHSLMVGCELLQKKFGLSDRETEIAFLLARGYSRPYVHLQEHGGNAYQAHLWKTRHSLERGTYRLSYRGGKEIEGSELPLLSMPLRRCLCGRFLGAMGRAVLGRVLLLAEQQMQEIDALLQPFVDEIGAVVH